MTTANWNWLSYFALKFKKDCKLTSLDVEKIVPCKENTQCQSRVKNVPFLDQNRSKAVLLGASETYT